MKISFSRDFGTTVFSLDEENPNEDVERCKKIEKLLTSEEWQILLEVFLAMKEKYDEAVMKVKPTLQSERETAMYAARLNGFWEAVKAPGKVAQAYRDYREKQIEELNARIDEAIGNNVPDLTVNE